MATSTVFDFEKGRKHFSNHIFQTLDKNEETDLDQLTKSHNGSPSEMRSTLDQVFRDVLQRFIKHESDCDKMKAIVKLSIIAVQKDLCTPQTPFLMLSDLFDTITLDKCDTMFGLVEENVDTWKSTAMFEAGKNSLLRMSNDLLRRLSKSFNTIFCGRIQLFLARLFPLSEKSALNLMSNFNVDNVTSYNIDSDDSHFITEDSMAHDGATKLASSSIPIDYNLYRRFWSLQSFFTKPNQCYEKISWKLFMMNSEAVLKAFDSYKLDDVKSSRKKQDAMLTDEKSQYSDYFAKYLTSEKLLNLQLSDSNFRRYVLVQFLILFQYLNANVKFKGESLKCTDEQANWTKATDTKIYQLLKETPPDGESFAKAIKHILERENNWNNWKNESCPTFIRDKPADTKNKTRPKKRSLGEDIRVSGAKITKMGHPELTRLWNINPDNTESCQTDKRVFLPTLGEFFADPIEQADPANMVEDQYKLVNNDVFQWRALRLLARCSPYFFTQSNQPSQSLSTYLETMLTKLAKEIPTMASEEMKTQVEEGEDELKETQDYDMKQEEDDEDEQDKMEDSVSKECIELVGEKLGSDWKRLATELNFNEDDITYLENDEGDVQKQAQSLLNVWLGNEGDRATQGALKIALKEVGLSNVIEAVWGSDET